MTNKKDIELNIPKEIQLLPPVQFIKVTASYSENLSPEQHGIENMRFENRNFFASLDEHILQTETTPELIISTYKKLYELCVVSVKSQVKKELDRLSNPGGLSTEELEQVTPFIKAIADGEDVNEVSTKIVEIKDTLNEKQLTFLRSLVKEKKNKNE